MKNGTETMYRIEAIVEQFACTYNPSEAAQTARKAIDTNFIVMDPKKLPPVSEVAGKLLSGNTITREGTTAQDALRRAREWMAIAEKLEHQQKEKANRERYLNKKRDEVYRRLYPHADPAMNYSVSLTAVKTAIDDIVRLEEELDSSKKFR